MSKSVESTVVKRKLSSAEKQECYRVFADLREKMYGGVATIGMTAEEFEVLDYFSSYPIATIQELQREHEFLKNAAGIVKKFTKWHALHQRGGYVSLTSIGWIYHDAAHEVLSPTPPAEPEVLAALQPSPKIEGRVILTPHCAYSPLCSETPVFGGVLVTFVSNPDPDVDLKHRNYCCEMHAALDLLRKAADEMLATYDDESTLYDDLADMARRSLNGEAILGEDQVSQSEIDSDVDRTLGPGDQA